MRYLAVLVISGIIFSITAANATAQTPDERLAACLDKLDRIEAVIHGSGNARTKNNRIHNIYHEAGICSLPPVPPPSGEPGPITNQGYEVVFEDMFNTLDSSTWCNRQWWEAPPVVGSQLVAGGELRLRRARGTGYANTTVSTEPCGQANPKSFKFGYMEARMRWETVRGNGPAFWMLSTRHATNPNFNNPAPWDPNPFCQSNGLPIAECYTSELDVVEGFGSIQYGGSRMDDFFSGALHRNSAGFYGVDNTFRFVQRGTGLEMDEYHTYAARWTATEICYFIDDQQQGCVAPYDSTPQPMHLLLYNWNTPWEDENMPDASSENELDVFVDWVRVWQKEPVTPPTEGTTIVVRDQPWRCRAPLSSYGTLPIHIDHRTTSAASLNWNVNGAIRLEDGCVGDGTDEIDLTFEIDGNGADIGPAGDAFVIAGGRDIQIGPSRADCGSGSAQGGHEDAFRANRGHRITLYRFQSGNWDNLDPTCHGAGGNAYFDNVNAEVTGTTDILCRECRVVASAYAPNPSDSGNIGVGAGFGWSTNSGAINGCWAAVRPTWHYIGAAGPIAVAPIDIGNFTIRFAAGTNTPVAGEPTAAECPLDY